MSRFTEAQDYTGPRLLFLAPSARRGEGRGGGLLNRRECPTGNWDAPVTYTYDDTNQLLSDTTASSHYSNTYEYNLAGNRTEKDGEAQTILAGNWVTDDGTYTYAYDEEGNIVKRTDPDGNERQLIYDYRNRLTEVKDYTGTIASGTLKQHVKYEYELVGAMRYFTMAKYLIELVKFFSYNEHHFSAS